MYLVLNFWSTIIYPFSSKISSLFKNKVEGSYPIYIKQALTFKVLIEPLSSTKTLSKMPSFSLNLVTLLLYKILMFLIFNALSTKICEALSTELLFIIVTLLQIVER